MWLFEVVSLVICARAILMYGSIAKSYVSY